MSFALIIWKLVQPPNMYAQTPQESWAHMLQHISCLGRYMESTAWLLNSWERASAFLGSEPVSELFSCFAPPANATNTSNGWRFYCQNRSNGSCFFLYQPSRAVRRKPPDSVRFGRAHHPVLKYWLHMLQLSFQDVTLPPPHSPPNKHRNLLLFSPCTPFSSNLRAICVYNWKLAVQLFEESNLSQHIVRSWHFRPGSNKAVVAGGWAAESDSAVMPRFPCFVANCSLFFSIELGVE